jgi:predicted DNA-binding transcriptional regulator AlpA
MSDLFAYPPRCMSRTAAARYLSIGTTTFDTLISEGKVPRGRNISVGRVVWDRMALDLYVDTLSSGDRETDYETYLQSTRKRK